MSVNNHRMPLWSWSHKRLTFILLLFPSPPIASFPHFMSFGTSIIDHWGEMKTAPPLLRKRSLAVYSAFCQHTHTQMKHPRVFEHKLQTIISQYQDTRSPGRKVITLICWCSPHWNASISLWWRRSQAWHHHVSSLQTLRICDGRSQTWRSNTACADTHPSPSHTSSQWPVNAPKTSQTTIYYTVKLKNSLFQLIDGSKLPCTGYLQGL